MKLNDIVCADYQLNGSIVYFILDTDFKTAAALEGETLLIKDGNSKVAEFGGFHLTGIENYADGMLKVTFARTLEPNTEQVISELLTNLDVANKNIEKNKDSISKVSQDASIANNTAVTANDSASSALNGLNDLSDQMDVYAGAIEELAIMIADATTE